MLKSFRPFSSKPKNVLRKAYSLRFYSIGSFLGLVAALFFLIFFANSAFAERQEFYLKGTFNGWQQSHPLSPLGAQRFGVVVSLPPGRFEFKISDSSWTRVYSADSTQPKTVSLDSNFNLVSAPGIGNNTLIEVRHQAAYRFTVVFVGDKPASMTISRDGNWVPPTPPFAAQGKMQFNKEFNVHFRVDKNPDGSRSFDLFSDAPQRDGSTFARQTFSEQESWPRLYSGSPLFDGLFATALLEAQQNETRYIRDGAFNRGSFIPCDCYVTGEKWGYVWTRDTAYAAHLGLGWLNNEKTWNSLAFKVSGLRGWQFESDSRVEIVQDTGTGGSWPVSTDRVTWALGASSVLENMPRGAVRSERLLKAFNAIRNSLERDRIAVFSQEDGLYKGEQSFLDWREQSYPIWTRGYVTAIADGKSLSTNIAHLSAIEASAAWAQELGYVNDVQRYVGWASILRRKIREHFFNQQSNDLNSLRLGSSYPFTLEERYDLLGTSLAVLNGIVTQAEARAILSKYPLSPAGSPVVWPQSPEVPIYHNRSIWPFVSAYAARAGAVAQHARFTARQLESVLASAALHLSNMENLEFTSGRSIYFEGANTGPVINSRRQLWSIGAFLSIVRDTLFGVVISGEALEFKPFIPVAFANHYFPDGNSLRLENYPLQGKRVTLVLKYERALVASEDAAYHKVSRIFVNGAPVESSVLSITSLPAGAVIEIELEDPKVIPGGIRELHFKDVYNQSSQEYSSYLAPNTPQISRWQKERNDIILTLDRRGSADTIFDIYRNGVKVSSNFQGTVFRDANSQQSFAQRCYVVIQKGIQTNLVSQPSPESCLFVGDRNATENVAERLGIVVSPFGMQGIAFGRLDATQNFFYTAVASKKHVVSFEYSNSYNDVSTGITAATRKVTVFREADGQEVASGIVTMPHLPRWDVRSTSSALVVNLEVGQRYRFELSEFFNMSNLSHYLLYDGAGGKEGPVNSSLVQNVFVAPLER